MKRNPTISVPVPPAIKTVLAEIADERTSDLQQQRPSRKVYAADIVREAIEEYLARRGYHVEVSVDRGGYRMRRED